jgi:hypothetical protein
MAGMYQTAASLHLTGIMSRVYPERKWTKERKQDTEKPKLNRVEQISILARSITERKPDIRRSGEKEDAAQRKIYHTD